jgi:hypothetical protein
MSYFNKILNGNIPLSIIECINGYNDKYRIGKNYPYLEINKSNHFDKDMKKVFDSHYGDYVKSSIDIDRQKIVNNVKDMLKSSLNNSLGNSSIDITLQLFINNFIDMMGQVRMSKYSKKIFLLIIDLTGITNKNIQDVQKKLSLELNSTNIKINKSINIKESLKNKMNDSSKNKINDMYINNLAEQFVFVLEDILENILYSMKHDNICNFYAFTIEVAKGLSYTVENFALFNANDTTNIDTTKITKLVDISKTLNQETILNGLSKIVGSSIVKAINKNQSDFSSLIKASNEISLKNVTTGGDVIIGNAKQETNVKSTLTSESKQKIENKIKDDISNELTDEVKNQAKNAIDNVKKDKDTTNEGSKLTDVSNSIGSSFDNFIDKTADVLSVMSANTTKNVTSKDTDDTLRENFQLNANFKSETNNDVSNAIEKVLSSENIAKTLNDLKTSNTIAAENINAGGSIKIENIDQKVLVDNVAKNLVSQEVLNDISTKMYNLIKKNIENMASSIDSKLSDAEKTKAVGDIQAFGGAAALVLDSAGGAVASTIDSTGTAAAKTVDSAGTAASKTIDSTGKAVTGVASALAGPIIIIGIIGLIGAGLYFSGALNKLFPNLNGILDEQDPSYDPNYDPTQMPPSYNPNQMAPNQPQYSSGFQQRVTDFGDSNQLGQSYKPQNGGENIFLELSEIIKRSN